MKVRSVSGAESAACCKARGRAIAGCVFRQADRASTSFDISRSKTGCIGAATPQGIGGERLRQRHAHFAQTTRELGGGEIVAGGHRGLESSRPRDGDDLFERVVRGFLQLLERQRLRRGAGCDTDGVRSQST